MVPDVLQDVHLIHGLDLLLLLLWPSLIFGWAYLRGYSWFLGQCWLCCHWGLGLWLRLGFGVDSQVQNLVQVLFNSREPK